MQMGRTLHGSKQGSAIIGALLVVIILGGWIAAMLTSSTTEVKMSHRYVEMQSAMNLAESGLDEGARAYLEKDWSGWSSNGSFYFKDTAPTTTGPGGGTGTIRIAVKNDATHPVVAAEGRLIGSNGLPVVKQVLVEISRSSGYDVGMLGRKGIVMNGNGVLVDSYRSSDGPYTTTSGVNRFANAPVATLSLSNSDVSINNADIFGYLSVGTREEDWNWSTSFHKNGSLRNYGEPIGKKSDDRLTTDFKADLKEVVVPSYGSFSVVGDPTSGIDDALTILNSGSYVTRKIDLKSSDKLVINGDVTLVVRESISIGGSSAAINLNSGATLKIYVYGNVAIGGNGIMNGSTLSNPHAKANDLEIIGASPTEGGQTIGIQGNGALYGKIYAPNALITVGGGGSNGVVVGSMLGQKITLNGGVHFIYDEVLAEGGDEGTLRIDFWRELKTQAERLDFDNKSSIVSAL